MKKSFCIVLSLACCGFLSAQGNNSKRLIEIDYTARFTPIGGVDSLNVNFSLPISEYPGRQKVIKIDFSRSPSRRIRSNEENTVLFEFSRLFNEVEITAKVQMEIYRHDLTAFESGAVASAIKKEKNLKKYLNTSEDYRIKSPERIPSEAFEGSTPLEKARSIHDFVVEHLEYQSEFGEDRGANYAFENKKGDCSEYSELMIALCRLQGIPAREVVGRTVVTEVNTLLGQIFKSSRHAWVEAYFDHLGWVAFDPTHSDGNHTINFNNLPNKYVYENINSQPRFGYQWWGNGKVQMKNEVNFREISADQVTIKP